jgi:hypothetical protein
MKAFTVRRSTSPTAVCKMAHAYLNGRTNKIQLLQYCLLVTARLLYMFRTLSAFIIRSTKNVVAATGAVHAMGRDNIYPVRMSEVGCHCTMS